MLKNTDVVDEVTAEQIRKRNERRQTKETKRKREVRRAIEARLEAKELGVDIEDIL